MVLSDFQSYAKNIIPFQYITLNWTSCLWIGIVISFCKCLLAVTILKSCGVKFLFWIKYCIDLKISFNRYISFKLSGLKSLNPCVRSEPIIFGRPLDEALVFFCFLFFDCCVYDTKTVFNPVVSSNFRMLLLFDFVKYVHSSHGVENISGDCKDLEINLSSGTSSNNSWLLNFSNTERGILSIIIHSFSLRENIELSK